uniref:Uncharacterized protein n=1 Tax=Macaca fascicularis TaxID=9541 RepID=A0A7N9CBQ9_MACFA
MSSQQPLPSQVRRLRRPRRKKKWFHGPGPGHCCFVQSGDSVSCVPAVAERGQHTAQAVASEGASPKPQQLTCGVGPAGAQKSIIEFGKFHLQFRGCMEMPRCPGRGVLQGWSPHGEPLLGHFGRKMWGQRPHTDSPLAHCLVEL